MEPPADTSFLLVVGDLTALERDALVNAANEELAGGGGVDGAIHRAAGPGLLAECRTLGGCPTGEARRTGGHRLRARWVVHTVGPVWRGGTSGEDALLASCYGASLTCAAEVGARRIAFPAISTGVYGFPKARAARIALTASRAWVEAAREAYELTFCCFEAEAARHYVDAARALGIALG